MNPEINGAPNPITFTNSPISSCILRTVNTTKNNAPITPNNNKMRNSSVITMPDVQNPTPAPIPAQKDPNAAAIIA